MRDVTAVTGPMRSGTSCITGLLERSGFDLGRNIRILRDETVFNPKGHFEPDLLYAIDERLLVEVPGGEWSLLNIPRQEAIAELAAQRDRYFHLFVRKFDGNLCKDPLFCMTLPFWERHWPELQKAVFCLRNPIAVARSMVKRYAITLESGLELWEIYTSRFFDSDKRCRVYVFDFDAFAADPLPAFAALLDWLERPLSQPELVRCLDGFFGGEYVHWQDADDDLLPIPDHVRELYWQVHSLAGRLERIEHALP